MAAARFCKSAIIVLLLTTFLAGCSSTKTAYRFADWGIVWWVEDYVTLTPEQADRLDQDLANLKQWHCSAELPRYTGWLTQLEGDLMTGVPDRDAVHYHQQRLLAFIPDLMGQAAPVAVNLLENLSDRQVNELADNMAKNQRELEQEMLAGNPEQTAKARAQRTRERLETWLGGLNKDQQTIVTDWSADRGRQTEIWLQGRQNWQHALIDALEKRGEPGFGARIEQLLVNYEQARGPAYQAMSAESQAAMADLLHDVLAAGDAGHRQHLVNRIQSLNGDFSELACL